jgi:HD superfamily phosphohydrolase
VEYGQDLALALEIFKNEYHRPFLHQLVSSQLDMDRLDYLNRDSFYSGVSEGVIGSERLIEMLNIHEGHLVLEEKGIYSVEKFLVARRLMYWQVYLHKTVVAAEFMLIHALRRAKQLVKGGLPLFASPSLQFFLSQDIKSEHFEQDPMVLTHFARLDDYDIWGAIKVWQFAPDYILATLCSGLVNRQLFKIEISKTPFSAARIAAVQQRIREEHQLSDQDLPYFIYSDRLTNKAYNEQKQNINLLLKNGSILELSKASDNLNISALSTPVEKYFLCYPR